MMILLWFLLFLFWALIRPNWVGLRHKLPFSSLCDLVALTSHASQLELCPYPATHSRFLYTTSYRCAVGHPFLESFHRSLLLGWLKSSLLSALAALLREKFLLPSIPLSSFLTTSANLPVLLLAQCYMTLLVTFSGVWFPFDNGEFARAFPWEFGLYEQGCHLVDTSRANTSHFSYSRAWGRKFQAYPSAMSLRIRVSCSKLRFSAIESLCPHLICLRVLAMFAS